MINAENAPEVCTIKVEWEDAVMRKINQLLCAEVTLCRSSSFAGAAATETLPANHRPADFSPGYTARAGRRARPGAQRCRGAGPRRRRGRMKK
jgi:hypothetical protein